MSKVQLYSVICIAACSGTIGFIIGMKLAWADAQKLYDPYVKGD